MLLPLFRACYKTIQFETPTYGIKFFSGRRTMISHILRALLTATFNYFRVSNKTRRGGNAFLGEPSESWKG